MRIGFAVPNSGPLTANDGLTTIARRVEDAGFDVLWVTDHVVMPRAYTSRYPYNQAGRIPIDADADYYEPIVALAHLGAVTSRIRIGTSVLILPYRNPVVTAKQIASVDALTGGRVTLGVGAGWLREEFEALGAPDYDHRGSVTDECIQLFKALWTQANPSFDGKYFQIHNVGFNPKPVQKPYPPILIGGDAPAALRRVARHGDGWQPFSYPVDELRDQLDRLRRICADEGRSYDDLAISFRLGIRLAGPGEAAGAAGSDPREAAVGTPAEILELSKRYQDLGIHELSFHHRGRPDLAEILAAIDTIAEKIAPALR